METARFNVPYWLKMLSVLRNDGRTLTDIVKSGELETYSQAQRTVSILSKMGVVKRISKGRNVFIHVSPAYRGLVEAAGVVVESATKKDVQKTRRKATRAKLSE